MNNENVSESNLKSLIQLALKKHKLGELEEAESLYQQLLQVQSQSLGEQEYQLIVLGNLGNIFEQQGKLEAAAEHYQQTLQLKPDYAEIHYNLGNVLRRQGKFDAAINSYQQALKFKPDHAMSHHNLGNLLLSQGQLDAAIESYQQALKFKPDHAMSHHNLGNLLLFQGQFDAARDSYQQALKFKPDYAGAYYNLGRIFQRKGELHAARDAYQQALKIKPDYAEAHYNLGRLFQEQGQLHAAREAYQQALKIKPDHAEAHHSLGCVFESQEQLDAAEKSYQQALKFLPDSARKNTYFNLGNIYSNQGKLDAAIETYQQALKINPDYSLAKLGILINQLPIIYSSCEEIKQRRNDYRQHLNELAQHYQNADAQQLKAAVELVGALQPFYLAYQGLNDRALQQTYGEMLVRIMSSQYPQWSQALPLPKLQANEKIRVGFVSRFFYTHSVWKIVMKGWVENLNRSEFELFGYHTGFERDRQTAKTAKAFDKFTQGSRSLEQWCNLIQQDQLHVLIFPEFGMDPTALKLGCLRLAPIQMTSWGHPNTSGLPTIDYYLSSDLMEPENAQEHYTEQLVRLPNLSISYTPLALETKAVSKKDLGLAEDEIMFWCCQSLFKYLPEHDDVFPRIARELAQAKFVFIKHQSEYITEVFCQRLRAAFKQFGLHDRDYCIFLPRMDTQTFSGTAAIADVCLDSLGWSGGNTTLETIAHHVPVVTLPGELMRGRHSMAILKMMGIEETIASSKEEYVQMAVRLGQDLQSRQSISQLIAQNKHYLYGDLKPVRALEDFLRHVVGKPRRSLTTPVAEPLRRALQAHRDQHFESAEAAYRQVLSIQPHHPEALYGLGLIAQQSQRFLEAENLFTQATQVQPDAVKAWFALGNLRQTQG
ncbi:MAG: tetratricopeptide repeat protein, partial [Cyanobacteria bacterium]|nr:tetratricopeptide repeat protein [Cyanobacteria bacterium GSL.Bin1]